MKATLNENESHLKLFKPDFFREYTATSSEFVSQKTAIIKGLKTMKNTKYILFF